MNNDSLRASILVRGDSRAEVYNSHPLVKNKQLFKTPVIEEALGPILHVIQHRKPGTCFLGRSRTGKTWTQKILQRVLPLSMPGIAIGHFNAVEHITPNENTFYSDWLLSKRHGIYTSHKVTRTRERLVNAIEAETTEASQDCKGSGQYVQFIDEAQDLSEQEWTWLKAVSNDLEKRDISLITISFAQPALEERRAELIARNRLDIIGRFMLQVYPLDGIRHQDDVAKVLGQLDDPKVLSFPAGSGVSYAEFFCPEKYADRWRMTEEASALWDEFVKAQRSDGIVHTRSVGMQWFVSAVREWLQDRAAVFDGRKEGAPMSWAEAVARSGYNASLC